jgi:hypothetical protein
MNKFAYVGECSAMSVDTNSIIDLNKTPCTKDCVDSNLSHDCGTPTTFDKPRQQYFRERYINMTPEEKEARREQQRKSYRVPWRKEVKVASNKRRRDMQKETLHPESIAMENPLFIPELVWPTIGASGAHGSAVKSSDWVIPESSATPFYIPPPHEEADDEGCDELLSGHMTQRSHVLSGQRHALLTRRNMLFERRIGSNTRTSNKDGDCMDEDRVDANTPLPQSIVTNNSKYRRLIIPFW